MRCCNSSSRCQQFLGGRISLCALAQELQRLHGLRADVLINRALIMRRDRLRSECRDVVARRQREMHLRRALAEERGISQIDADQRMSDFGDGLAANASSDSFDAVFAICDAASESLRMRFEEAADGIERVAPGVAGIRCVRLQNSDR